MWTGLRHLPLYGFYSIFSGYSLRLIFGLFKATCEEDVKSGKESTISLVCDLFKVNMNNLVEKIFKILAASLLPMDNLILRRELRNHS